MVDQLIWPRSTLRKIHLKTSDSTQQSVQSSCQVLIWGTYWRVEIIQFSIAYKCINSTQNDFVLNSTLTKNVLKIEPSFRRLFRCYKLFSSMHYALPLAVNHLNSLHSLLYFLVPLKEVSHFLISATQVWYILSNLNKGGSWT